MDIDLKVVVFILVCVVIVAVLVFARIRGKAWQKAFLELERYTGLKQQSDFIPDGNLRKLEFFTRGSEGKRASNVIGGVWQSQPVKIFKYNYIEYRRSGNSSSETKYKETHYIVSTQLHNTNMPDFVFKYIPRDKNIYILTGAMREDLLKMAENPLFSTPTLPDRAADIDRIYQGFSKEVRDFIMAKKIKGFIQVNGKEVALIMEGFYIKPGELNAIFSNFIKLVKLIDAPGGFTF